VALVAALAWTPAEINALIDASFAAVVSTHVLTALLLTALVGTVVYRLKALRADAPDAGLPERPMWVGLLVALIGVLVIAIWVLVAVGYVALASFLASQLTWSGIVAAAFYVLFKFADDVFMALVSSRSTFGQRLQKSFNLAPQTLDQAATVLSGLSRVGLFFYMLIALAAPLGTGPGEVFQRSGKFGTGVKVGEFQLVPGAILGAIAVAVVGFIVLRVFKRWLERSYLPNTKLEPGMQSSLTTLLGYVGGILVIAFALSAMGIGIERIAWVASALSVGIGFGLQAIVQNFISGLILLAEQPVKVGDWVVLGTAEGDVRRINVRATEIQLGDRSTLIVPNSEFITKTVRNMTLANAEGRVLIRLPMPLTTDAQRVRESDPGGLPRARRCAGNAGAFAHAGRHRERALDLPGHRLCGEPAAGGRRAQRPAVRDPRRAEEGRAADGDADHVHDGAAGTGRRGARARDAELAYSRHARLSAVRRKGGRGAGLPGGLFFGTSVCNRGRWLTDLAYRRQPRIASHCTVPQTATSAA
jgi:potassium efflux system protein